MSHDGGVRNEFGELSFMLSVASIRQLPADAGLEVAFGGRSNAGKSTAINVLAGRKALARTSKTPGRTQQINYFEMDEIRRIVDLPGYGFAKAPPSAQAQWGRLVEDYLKTRQSLAGLVLLVDVRRPLTALDQQIVHWCEGAQLPIHLVLTKSDKLPRSKAALALAQTRRQMEGLTSAWSAQLFSALKRQGLDDLKAQLKLWLKLDKVGP